MERMEIQTVLALTDLEEDSLTGLRAGYALAARHNASLVVGHVLVPRTLDPSDVKEFLAENGLDASTVTIDIEVNPSIISGIDVLVDERSPDLIVISRQPRHGVARVIYSSLTLSLVGETRAPVLVYHQGQETFNFKRALVCLDGSPEATRLLEHAAALLDDDGDIVASMVIEDSPLVIAGLHIGTWSEETMAKAREAAEEYLAKLTADWTGPKITTDVRTGSAVHELINARLHHHADLMVIGTGGIGGQTRFMLGKVAGGVVRHIHVPSLVVPAGTGDGDG